MIITTDGCRNFKHPEIELHYDESAVWGLDATFLTTHLQEQVAAAERFWPDETIQIGWMQLKFAETDSEHLTLLEPDMEHFPIRWQRSVTRAIRYLHLSKWVAESVGLEEALRFCSYMHMGIVCERLGDGAIIMERSNAPAEGNDSGWFLGCRNEEHDHSDRNSVKPMSLYEAAYRRPVIIPFFSLPAGTQVIVSASDNVEVYYAGEKRTFAAGSYLDKLTRKKTEDS